MLSNLADSFARQDRIEEVRRAYNIENHTTYLARTAIRTHGRTGCGRLRLASATLISRDLVSTTLCLSRRCARHFTGHCRRQKANADGKRAKYNSRPQLHRIHLIPGRHFATRILQAQEGRWAM